MNVEELLDQIDQTRAIGVGILLAGLYWGLMFDDGSNLENQINNKKNEIVQNEKKIKKIENSIEIVKKFQLKVQNLGDKFDKLIRYIPEEFTPGDQMKIISDEAASAGTSILSVSDGGLGAKHKFYEEMFVDVQLKGSYTQIILFLSYLTKLDKVLVLKEMKMTGESVQGAGTDDNMASVSFTGKLVGYRFIKDTEKK